MNRRDMLKRSAVVCAGWTPLAHVLPAFARRPTRAVQSSRMRCVDLSVLQDGLMGRCRHATCHQDALLHMGGLEDIAGFMVDRRGTIILLGPIAKPGGIALRTDDWVHAMRSATHRYLDDQGRFSPPGVSIDPHPQVVRKLMRFDGSGFSADEPRASRTVRAWGAICEAPQKVRPMGLEREGLQSRYLFAIELADETMKSYVDGTLSLPGLVVPSRVMLARQEVAFRSGAVDRTAGGFAMSRYWFNSGTVRCGVDADVCMLLQCDVRVSTEAQMIARHALVDSQHRDELADQCAESFTSLLPGLAQENAIYATLMRIYRIQAIAVSMVKLQAEQRSGLDLSPILDRWAPPLHEVPRTVPGRWAVRSADFRRERDNGYEIARVRIPSCGGVNVNPVPQILGDQRGRRIAQGVLVAKAGHGASRPLYWDVPGDAFGRALG